MVKIEVAVQAAVAVKGVGDEALAGDVASPTHRSFQGEIRTSLFRAAG